jgi:formylglycine-generating enzyme required for sulfatase activity
MKRRLSDFWWTSVVACIVAGAGIYSASACDEADSTPYYEPPPIAKTDFTPKNPDKVGDTLKVDMGLGVSMELVWIPAGELNMGSNDGYGNEKPVHLVKISKGFWIGRFEVNQAQWERIMNYSPSYFKGPNLPAEQVSWHDAQQFCQLMNGLIEGGGFRLPSEAEWESAARAGTSTKYSYGDSEDELFKYGNYCDASNTDDLPWQDRNHNDGRDGSAPIGSYKPNPWGLYDLHGNVWEWCQDWYGEVFYAESPQDNPHGPPAGTARVLRGGSWFYNAAFCRSTFRSSCIPVIRSCNIGFRVVCSK